MKKNETLTQYITEEAHSVSNAYKVLYAVTKENNGVQENMWFTGLTSKDVRENEDDAATYERYCKAVLAYQDLLFAYQHEEKKPEAEELDTALGVVLRTLFSIATADAILASWGKHSLVSGQGRQQQTKASKEVTDKYRSTLKTVQKALDTGHEKKTTADGETLNIKCPPERLAELKGEKATLREKIKLARRAETVTVFPVRETLFRKNLELEISRKLHGLNTVQDANGRYASRCKKEATTQKWKRKFNSACGRTDADYLRYKIDHGELVEGDYESLALAEGAYIQKKWELLKTRLQSEAEQEQEENNEK